MKRTIAALLVATMLMLSTGCNGADTVDGVVVECIGIGEDKHPDYEYEVDVLNIVGAVIFFELIIPPIYVALEAVRCPVRKKSDKS